ncbi:MAG TPA: hypothetical protein VKB88_17135, partial [Bryobacteraceae bacterium]|nr:hypothetical protein [Bryobacteraceae bacterium]
FSNRDRFAGRFSNRDRFAGRFRDRDRFAFQDRTRFASTGWNTGWGGGWNRGWGWGGGWGWPWWGWGWGGGWGWPTGVSAGYWPSYSSWDYPYDDSYGYDPPPAYSSSMAPSPAYSYGTPPAAPTIVNVQTAQPVMHTYDQYGQEVQPSGAGGGGANGSPIFLIATKDGVIRAAASYWVQGGTVHYVTLQREEKTVPVGSIDRTLTNQLNRERHVNINFGQ